MTPVVENISGFFGCLNELTELVASSNIGDGDVYWYDSQIGGNLVFEGTNYNPDISETTSFFVSPFADGECETFNRIEVSAVINPSPTPVAPDDNIIPCENSKLSEISLKYPIPFSSSKLVPVE